jgi:hypothetical protein
MTQIQTEAWKKIRNVGTVGLIVGWIEVAVAAIFMVIVGIVVLFGPPSDFTAGETAGALTVFGFVFLIFLFVAALGIVKIIAGVKLRQQVPNPKPWVITLLVFGILGAGTIPGLILLIFAILAMVDLNNIGTLPIQSPKQTPAPKPVHQTTPHQRQLEAWKRVRHAGTVALVFGWIGIVATVLVVIGSILLITFNFEIPSDDGEPLPSWVVGVFLLVFFLVFSLPFAIVDIIAGIKLRKPIPRPRGWLIYLVVVGALGAGSIAGILELIFSILALSSLHEIEGQNPPAYK